MVLAFKLLRVEKVSEEEMGHGGDAELPRGQKGWSADEWCCWNHHLLLRARPLVSGSSTTTWCRRQRLQGHGTRQKLRTEKHLPWLLGATLVGPEEAEISFLVVS